jgi:hypothetical protein
MDGANPAEGGSHVPLTIEDAQRRADRIRAFTGELAALEGESVVRLTEEQRLAIADYHGETLRSLALRFDIDIGSAEKQMSMGMRIVSFLGASLDPGPGDHPCRSLSGPAGGSRTGHPPGIGKSRETVRLGADRRFAALSW